MKHFIGYQCTLCGRTFPSEQFIYTCPFCKDKGILEVLYDYDLIKKTVNLSYFKNNTNYSMWRYAPLMSVGVEHLGKTLKIGWTPLYKSKRLSAFLELENLYIKDEGLNPSGSTKDRASGVAVVKALEVGAETISCSSTGNAASSLACQAAHIGLKTVIFVPKRAPIGKLTQLQIYGATLICVDGDYKATYNLSKEAIEHYGWYNRNAAINSHLVEGKKTVALEIAEQLNFKPTDWVVISVGDGCSISGVYKGFYDLKQIGLIENIPKILGVQSSGCAPFVIAYENDVPLVEAEENTLADSIAVGIPRNPIKAMNSVKKSDGVYLSVEDKDILDSMGLLGRLEGIFAEPAGATSLAGLRKALTTGIIKPVESVTIIITGNGLKDPVNAQKAIKEPIILEPKLSALNDYLNKIGVN